MLKLGFGLMRLPRINDSYENIDKELFKKMIDEFILSGGTYFDTAWVYHGGNSELAVKECLIDRYDRSKFTLADKMPMFAVKEESDLEKYFNKQLEKTQAGYFDYYLLHALNKKTYDLSEQVHAFDFIKKKKEEGLIKHIGFSFHDSSLVLEEILKKHPEIEFVQLQINYLDWESPSVESKNCYNLCEKYNKEVVVMEPVKGGALFNIPSEAEELFTNYHKDLSKASWAIRYAASLKNVMMVLSGMSNFEQMKDNLSYMKDFKPLTKEEYSIIDQVVAKIKSVITVDCTGCRYCITEQHCPKDILIPDLFTVYNGAKNYTHPSPSKAYNELTKSSNHGSAGDCLKCGACEKHCPQHLDIRKYLSDIKLYFE